MERRFLGLLMVVSLAFSGCVAKSDYLQKQAEADELGKRIEALTADQVALQERIAKLTEEKEALLEEKDKLATDQQSLQERYKAKAEEAARNLQEMKKRTVELEGDKEMLKESIDLLKKTKEEAIQNVSSTYEDLLKEMKGEIEQGQIQITELQGKLTMDVVDKILFDSGSAEVKPEGLKVLKRVVEILKTVTDKTIRIEGHTDNVRITGALAKRYPTNWELSAARAINVTRYLQKEGLDPAVLSATAYGEFQPVADNETPEGRAKNRRIAIILLPKEEEEKK